NGQKGFINESEDYLNEGNTISFGQDTATMFYQEKPYFTGDKIKILTAKFDGFNKNNAWFFMSSMKRVFYSFSWGTSSFSVDIIKEQKLNLPVINDDLIDFGFINEFVAELDAERIAELETYLTAAGLKNYELTPQEQIVLDEFENDNLSWRAYNIKALFGPSTRGKRLKSSDRLSGDLPFVTAGESSEGVSAFICNDVTVFPENTTTIDMFGTAKYRNYKYGADDHITVVHTENLPGQAAIFITTSIHKSSYTGKFDYGRNFYAKDADNLMISLPVKNDKPDFSYMSDLISAIQKLVIKDVVRYTEKKMSAYKHVVAR
ncbi:restriction endonuclease subunit S, partial [Salmonella enterica]|nr:restriction endonuclease subunit S [Salmonella enterica]